MRFVYFPFNLKNFPKFVGMFIVGLFVGGVITLFIHGANYDKLYVEKKELESYVVELQNTIERLEKSQQQQTKELTVREIIIETNFKDAVKNVYIKSEVSDLLKNLIGENVEEINPELVFYILENRIISVEGSQYKLTLRTLTIAKKINVNLNVTELSSENGADE